MPGPQDRELLRQAMVFNKPRDVLLALVDSIEHDERVRQENIAHERSLRNDAYEDKRTEWKRAERAELWRNAWCISACVGWLALLYLIYSAR